MHKKKILIISFAAICVFIVAGIIITMLMPSISFKNQKRLFADFEPTGAITEFDSVYYARYDMTLSEWQEFQNKLKDFQIISNYGGMLQRFSWASFADSLFTPEEVGNFSDVYYQSKYTGGLFFNKYLSESLIAVCINDDNVSIYYSTGVSSSLIK